MSTTDGFQAPKQVVDEYGNIHQFADKLAEGGQGVVFRTKDADLAIKQPLDEYRQPNKNISLHNQFQNVRLLPMPARVPISLPLAILRDEPGYVMRLLSGMMPFETFDSNIRKKKELEDQKIALPQWLAGILDKDMAWRLLHYANTGSTRRRLFALAKCASILARLHSAGLVYGDISPNNAFIGKDSSDVWLIDADNMRFELQHGDTSAYTPGYAAPEVVRGIDSSRPRSDCWAFSVMAFKLLSLCHPFIGKKVLESEGEEGGWDAEPVAGDLPADLDERAYAGYFPFIDDEDDDSNQGVGGLPRELVITPQLCRLFQETFSAGREHPHRRPAMAFWALELTRAFDHSLECSKCQMSYFVIDHEKCPYCGEPRPVFIIAKTSRWETIIPGAATEVALPHRLFHPFSFEHNDDTEFDAIVSFPAKTVLPVRGTKPFSDKVTFEFVG